MNSEIFHDITVRGKQRETGQKKEEVWIISEKLKGENRSVSVTSAVNMLRCICDCQLEGKNHIYKRMAKK